MVERFFARITNEAIRRGSFSSVRQLQAAIDAYLAEHNKDPKPFVWTASQILSLENLKLPFLMHFSRTTLAALLMLFQVCLLPLIAQFFATFKV